MEISGFGSGPVNSGIVPAETGASQGGSSAPDLATEQRQLIQAVKALNASSLFGEDRELTFILDRASHRTLVRLVDRETRKVVLQIPAEYVIRLAQEDGQKSG